MYGTTRLLQTSYKHQGVVDFKVPSQALPVDWGFSTIWTRLNAMVLVTGSSSWPCCARREIPLFLTSNGNIHTSSVEVVEPLPPATLTPWISLIFARLEPSEIPEWNS